MTYRFIFFVLVAGILWWHFGDVFPTPTNAILAPKAPIQSDLAAADRTTWTYHDCTITPLARYSIKARILSREPYWLDACALVSPLDLALGWGPMSDPTIYKKLNISQGMRWYTWHWWGTPPIASDDIPLDSANTHIIPATPSVGHILADFRANDVVQLDGYLVAVDGPHGFHWSSSVSRTDTGGGSCELMWVKEARKVGR